MNESIKKYKPKRKNVEETKFSNEGQVSNESLLNGVDPTCNFYFTYFVFYYFHSFSSSKTSFQKAHAILPSRG